MLRRFNQKIKEKTGRAQRTEFSVEVERSITFTGEMKKHLPDIENRIGAAYSAYKTNGLTKLEKCAERISKVAVRKKGKKIGTVAAATGAWLADQAKKDRQTHTNVTSQFCQGFCHSFVDTEVKQCLAICDRLKKARLDKDSCVNGPKADEMDAAYEATLTEANTTFAKYPQYQQKHASEFKKLFSLMSSVAQDKITAGADCKKL